MLRVQVTRRDQHLHCGADKTTAASITTRGITKLSLAVRSSFPIMKLKIEVVAIVDSQLAAMPRLVLELLSAQCESQGRPERKSGAQANSKTLQRTPVRHRVVEVHAANRSLNASSRHQANPCIAVTRT
jgi:hypothetical protein